MTTRSRNIRASFSRRRSKERSYDTGTERKAAGLRQRRGAVSAAQPLLRGGRRRRHIPRHAGAAAGEPEPLGRAPRGDDLCDGGHCRRDGRAHRAAGRERHHQRHDRLYGRRAGYGQAHRPRPCAPRGRAPVLLRDGDHRRDGQAHRRAELCHVLHLEATDSPGSRDCWRFCCCSSRRGRAARS